MNQFKSGQKTLISVHGYLGDKQQVLDLLPVFQHHECPIVVMSPTDSQIHGIGPHICRTAGLRAYVGQLSLDRQWAQMKVLMEYPFDFYLMNDSDSFCITPEIPQYLYDQPDVLFSNQVNDFRKPGESWDGMKPWPLDYHKGLPLLAFQPPYFLSRSSLEKIVEAGPRVKACPITPFIDWGMVQVCYEAGVKHKPFEKCASCETVTDLGKRVMQQCIIERGAEFIHSIKSRAVVDMCLEAHKKRNCNG